ncbi:PREDICTED: group 3 secretory phospholipase A2-like, partial [Chaetura pelagica]|uniref:group 3 secretory phospholipase A2-like n=1 Tax=Chaetura pelagica TaxID=8897 RepID=UPI00052321D0
FKISKIIVVGDLSVGKTCLINRYPGTLWCGAGSNADAYEQLGKGSSAAAPCPPIPSFLTPSHPHLSQLKECLQRVNDTASRVVGQAFFNVIQVPCFEFAYKEECVEPYLYVWCRAYNTVAIAVPREPVLYDFGGELIDRAARPGGVLLSPPWSSTGWEKHSCFHTSTNSFNKPQQLQ